MAVSQYIRHSATVARKQWRSENKGDVVTNAGANQAAGMPGDGKAHQWQNNVIK